jgi:CRP-like cAMP-binding protein
MADDKKKYANMIRTLIPINELATDLQDQVIKEAALITVRRKGTVFKQGARDTFSYYLLEGEIELLANRQVHNTIVSGTDQARYPMAQLQPRQFSGVSKANSVILRLPRNSLDRLLVLNQEKNGGDDFGSGFSVSEVEVSELEEGGDVDWMSRLLQSDIFAKMPTANIHQLFALLEPVEYSKGAIVVKQGDPGEDFYIISEGRCHVTRQPNVGGKEIKLAELSIGDSFGEEALISESTRNATVSMVTNGTLMRLNKQHFIELIRDPTLHAITYVEAEVKVQKGEAKWLDVRSKSEHEKSSIDDSVNIPLNTLRAQMEKLDKGTYYIIYCDTGGRSSTAAFLMSGSGFDVSYLKGGLVDNLDAAEPSEVTNVPGRAAHATKPRTAPAGDKTAGKKQDSAEELTDPHIKASYLKTEIARTDMELEKTATKKQKDEALKQAQAEMQKKLEQERAALEAARKAAEADAVKQRKAEEEKLARVEAEAKKRIEDEKKRLEDVYARNADEMEKLEKMKQEAEEKARLEREKLEKHAKEAHLSKSETERLKKELENARQAMTLELEKRKKEQEALERKIQMKARQKLEEERKKLAEQYALNNQELEKARREKAAAEAARIAAQEEADRVISEYKSQYDKNKAAEDDAIKAERRKLEEQQREIQEALQQVQAAKADAEALKVEAAKELSGLREKQRQSAIAQDGGTSLKSEIKQAEARLNQARINIAKSQQQTVKIQEEKRMNAADLEAKKAEQDEMKKRLAADLANFKEELEEQEREFSNTTQRNHMQRIKKRAEEARAKAQIKDAGLLAEIRNQLGKK